jgi:hypothetical protein
VTELAARVVDAASAVTGLTLTLDESMYNDLLPGTVSELEAVGLLALDDGALCAFPDGFSRPRRRSHCADRAQVRRRLRLRDAAIEALAQL